RQPAVFLGLRKPRGDLRTETETCGWLLGIPGNRHATPVAPRFGSSGALECRVLAVFIRHRRVFRQPEFLSLVDVGGTGEGKHLQRRCLRTSTSARGVGLWVGGEQTVLSPALARQPEPTDVSDDVVIREHP